MREENLERIKSKIAKLFKLAEGSSNEHEAANAMAKARKLMDEYQLQHSEIIEMGDGSKAEFSHAQASRVFNNVPAWLDILSVQVARFNDCQSYCEWDDKTFKVNKKTRGRKLVFRGYKHDVEMAINMYSSLIVAINKLCADYLEEIGHEGRYPVGLGNSFKLGASRTLCERLKELTKERQLLTTSSGTGLVLIKSKAVAAHFGEIEYINKKTSIGKSDGAENAYSEGRKRGHQVEIQKQVKSY